MTKFKAALAALLMVPTLVATGGSATAQTTGYTWADFSMMFGRNAGQVRTLPTADNPSGTPVSQWAWSPQSSTESWIRWADPAVWKTETNQYIEHYQVDPAGGWVYMDGWSNNGTYYKIREIVAWAGDVNCNNLTQLPADPAQRQHYVQWQVPTTAYCVRSIATITEQSSGKVIFFAHDQKWYPPAPCSSTYVGAATCITQYELWQDNRGVDLSGPISKKQERTGTVALGKGMAFNIRNAYPSTDAYDGYSFWTY